MEPIVQEIFDLVKVKLREQGAYDYDAYAAVVRETIDYYHERGYLTDDDNDQFIEDQLLNMWEWLQEHMDEEE
jgi:hypothetical protein